MEARIAVMNRLQKKEYELLKTFISVCDKLGLKYFLLCGSVLGAVKYKGFIPWDDDIDVGLYREDYEVFCEKAPEYFSENIFLQNFKTDKNFPAIYAKLRDSSTTYIEKSVEEININHGIAIDIFPLDGYPRKKISQLKLECMKWFYVKILSIPCKREDLKKEKIINLLRKIGIGKNSSNTAKRYTAMISKYKPVNGGFICNHGNWQGKLDYFDYNVLGEGTISVFEDIEVIVPEQYDIYLKQK